MHNRASFWSPVPDFSQATLHGDGITIVPVANASLWLISGDLKKFLTHHNLHQIVGPRQCCDDARYGLRLAPDRMLFVSEGASADTFELLQDGCAITDVSDGLLLFDINGENAAQLMAQAGSYSFTATQGSPEESAFIRFADFKLALSRRGKGWRLHIERPWAPALWHWLQAHVEQG